jgi:superfamily II DNA/RNA helicase
VVVGTPGRILDLVAHNALDLSAVHALVLDEADRLLDLGFSDELQRILGLLPVRRQNLFFSATFPSAVQALAHSLLHDPVRVDVAPVATTPTQLTQRALAVDSGQRTQLLRHLIQAEAWPRVLVFVATQHSAEVVADKLRRVNLNAEPFHGALSQGKRTQVLADFKASRVQVVVATDVAARGLDIALLPVVVNYDLPRSAAEYVHRVGRTGRAGAAGLAVSFVSASTQAHWQLIEKRQRIQLARETLPGFEPTEVASPAPPSTGGIKGRRPSKKDKLRVASDAAPAASEAP